MEQDELLEVYFQETTENLEEAESCMLGLEKSFSMEQLNSLFRCVHTIKGNSAAVNFGEISTFSHKLEDILNYVRDGKLEFNLENSNLCFSSIDELIELFNRRRQYSSDEVSSDAMNKTLKLQENMDKLIASVKENVNQEESLELHISPKFQEDSEEFLNTYFISILFDVKDVMHSITRFMIINSMNENGKISYSSPPVEVMISMDDIDPIHHYECLFKTNLDSELLFNKLDIPFIQDIKIVNVTSGILSKEELGASTSHVDLFLDVLNQFFAIGKYYKNTTWSKEAKDDIYKVYKKIQQILELEELNVEVITLMKELSAFVNMQLFIVNSSSKDAIELFQYTHNLYISSVRKIYEAFKNKLFFKYVQLQVDKENIERLDNLYSKLNKNTFKYVFIDISKLEILERDVLIEFIKVYESLLEDGIEVSIINGGNFRKRLYNILESIKAFEEIKQYYDEANAIQWFDLK